MRFQLLGANAILLGHEPSPTTTDNSKTYGHLASDTGTLSGLVNGDGITVTFASAGDAATAAVGHYTITATISDPNGKPSNYIVHKTTATLTVTKAPLTITADNKTKIRGQANPDVTGERV